MTNPERRAALEEVGYTVFPQVYSQDLVARLRVAIDEKALKRPDALASYKANPFQGIFSISQIGPIGGRIDPAIPELLAWGGACPLKQSPLLFYCQSPLYETNTCRGWSRCTGGSQRLRDH